MSTHLDQRITLGDLSRIAGMSPFAFCRKFRRATGYSPRQWLLKERVAKAQALVGEGRGSLTDVSYEVGFSSQAHFCLAFRKRTGMTPRQWKRHVLATNDSLTQCT